MIDFDNAKLQQLITHVKWFYWKFEKRQLSNWYTIGTKKMNYPLKKSQSLVLRHSYCKKIRIFAAEKWSGSSAG